MNVDVCSGILSREKFLTACQLALIVLAAYVVMFPSFYVYGGSDWGQYVNCGRQLSEGHTLYTDCWSHKPPLLFLYLAGWFSIFGATWSTAHWALLPIYAAFGIGVYSCYRCMFTSKWMALASSLLALMVVQRWDWDRNGAILLLATAFELFAMTCFWKSIVATDSKKLMDSLGLTLTAGLFAGAAFCTRASGLAAFAPPLLWWLYHRNRVTFKLGLKVAFGACLFIIFIVGFCALLGFSGQEFWRSNVIFNAAYAEAHQKRISWHRLLESVRLIAPILWAFAGAATFFAWQESKSHSKENGTSHLAIRLLLGQLLVVLTLRIMAAKIIPYYNFAFLPYISILAVFAMRRLAGMCRPVSLNRLAAASVVLALMYPLIRDVYRVPGVQLDRWKASLVRHQMEKPKGKGSTRLISLLKGFDPSKLPDRQVMDRVKERLAGEGDLADDQQVFVYGSRGWLYYLDGIRSPVRFHARPGMFGKALLTPDEFADTIRTLEEKKPRFVVQWQNSVGPQPDDKRHPRFHNKPIESMNQDEYFYDQFLSNYQIVEKFEFANQDCWPYRSDNPVYIYERREPEGSVQVADRFKEKLK